MQNKVEKTIRSECKPRFCVQVLMFNVDASILQMIDNCAPYVEKIYIAWSMYPWTYNKSARDTHANPTSLEILEQSIWREKIILVKGEWEKEEDQRNACLDLARLDGMDYMIIQDADEFYTAEAYIDNIETIIENPNHPWYKTPWCIYWKTIDWCIIGENGGIIVGFPQFAVNCNDQNIKFVEKRELSMRDSGYLLRGLCHHLAYVLEDDAMLRKIETWGHSNEFNRMKWYQNKWINWYPSMKYLHPVKPAVWQGVIKVKHEKPPEILKVSVQNISIGSPTTLKKIENWILFKQIELSKYLDLRKLKRKFFSIFLNSSAAFGELLGIFERSLSQLTWKAKAKSIQKDYGQLILHLGCGNSRKEGMLNCEIRSTSAADVVMDCSKLSRFQTNSVDVIYSHAFFEHLYVQQRAEVLQDCCRIIKNDGCIVFLGLPDFKVVAQSYLNSTSLYAGAPFDLSMVYRYTHGAPESTAPSWWMAQLHKGLLDSDNIIFMMKQAGFSRGYVFNYRYPGEDIPLNLGVIAWKTASIEKFDLKKIIEPFSDCIRDEDDLENSILEF